MMSQNRTGRLAVLLAAGALTTSFPSGSACASPVNWADSVLVQTQGALVNPVMIVGFNPQPEPPAYDGKTAMSIVDGELQLRIPDISAPVGVVQNFQFVFGVASNAGPLKSFTSPPEPINDFRIGFGIEGDASADFTAVIDVVSTSGGVMAPGSEISFNPQPEPPALEYGGFTTYGLDFAMTTLSDVVLTLRIEDDAGERVDLVRVPEPTTAAIAGLCVLAMSIRRRLSRP